MGTTLVTGGAGFIGSRFVELLFDREPDEEIIVLDVLTYAADVRNIPPRIRESPRFRLVEGNVCSVGLVQELVAGADRVVHFAAESHVTRSIADDHPFFETDVMGTLSVASAVSRNLSRIWRLVHVSTSEVYGTALRDPMDEHHPLNPCTPYAAAKCGADRLVHAYRETYGIPTVIVRPFNNYGPRQHLEKLVPRFVTAALDGQPLTVHGDGRMTRDWLYVGDTCEAIWRALTSMPALGEVVNLGTGVDTSVLDVAHMILAAAGKPRSLIRHVEARPGQVDRHISSTARARELLGGWQHETGLVKGIQETVRWYADNREWWAGKKDGAVVDVTCDKRQIAGAF